MAGGMNTGSSGRSLAERLDLDPPIVEGSDAPVRKPHVWVDRDRDLPAPGVVLRQAKSATDQSWIVKVTWVAHDPMRPEEPAHRTEWVPAARVKTA